MPMTAEEALMAEWHDDDPDFPQDRPGKAFERAFALHYRLSVCRRFGHVRYWGKSVKHCLVYTGGSIDIADQHDCDGDLVFVDEHPELEAAYAVGGDAAVRAILVAQGLVDYPDRYE